MEKNTAILRWRVSNSKKSTSSLFFIDFGSRDSVVSILTRLRARRSGHSKPGRGKRFFFSPKHRHRPWAHPASYSVDVKRPELENDHSPPSGAEVKNKWRSTSTPPTCLHDMYRDLTFYLFICLFIHLLTYLFIYVFIYVFTYVFINTVKSRNK